MSSNTLEPLSATSVVSVGIDDIAGKRRRGRPAGSEAGKASVAKEPLPPKYRDSKTGKTW